MIEVRTGYYPKVKKYMELGYLPVSISNSKPDFFNGLHYKVLAPNWSTISNYRQGVISRREFKEVYTVKLCNMHNHIVDTLTYLESLARENNCVGIVFLCWEKPTDFCHRFIFADYLKAKLNIEVCELNV